MPSCARYYSRRAEPKSKQKVEDLRGSVSSLRVCRKGIFRAQMRTIKVKSKRCKQIFMNSLQWKSLARSSPNYRAGAFKRCHDEASRVRVHVSTPPSGPCSLLWRPQHQPRTKIHRSQIQYTQYKRLWLDFRIIGIGGTQFFRGDFDVHAARHP